MKYFSSLFLIAVVGILAFSNDGDAFGRRRCRCPHVQRVCVVAPVDRDKRLETDKRNIPEFTEASAHALSFQEPDGDTFTVRQHDRGLAKTTYATAAMEVFVDLPSLILSLAPDEDMIAKTEKNWDFGRVEDEQRNVRVTAYLFAVRKESDNDFHLILDDDGNLEDGAKLNAEISGIPNEGPDRNAIRQVRDSFKSRFNGNPPTQYRPFLGPIRVVIEGSLFFDRDHPPGTVGPQGYRPASAWEIHPIRSIEFLDN
jgi:hypothetical protein